MAGEAGLIGGGVSEPDPCSLEHSHVFLGAAHDRNARRTRWVVGITAVTMIGEIAAGYVYGSMALLADGFHMATHAGALGIAAVAYAYAKHHAASGRYSFGTGKVGDLASFASSLILIFVALGIAGESILRLAHPQPVQFGYATIVAVIGLAVNLLSAVLLGDGHGHHHDHEHDHEHGHGHAHGRDNNLRSAYLHVVADALTSVLAIAALLAGRYLGWLWLDPAIGILGAVVIARWAWGLMRENAAVLLDATDPALEKSVRAVVEVGSTRITDLHIWRIGPGAHAAIVSVTGTGDPDAIRARVAQLPAIAHVTVELR